MPRLEAVNWLCETSQIRRPVGVVSEMCAREGVFSNRRKKEKTEEGRLFSRLRLKHLIDRRQMHPSTYI